MDLASYFNDSKDAVSNEFANGPDDIPAGERVLAVITKAEAKVSAKGAPGWKTTLKVSDGEYKGMLLTDNTYLSPGDKDTQRSFNKRQFAKLQTVVPAELFTTTTPEGIAAALTGQPVGVVVGWQDPTADGFTFGDHKWFPADGEPVVQTAPAAAEAPAAPAGFGTEV